MHRSCPHGALHPVSFFLWDGLRAQRLEDCPPTRSRRSFIAPNIGSYVGGDITAGTLASGIWDSDALSLFIDLGTNGEIVFGNRDFLDELRLLRRPRL